MNDLLTNFYVISYGMVFLTGFRKRNYEKHLIKHTVCTPGHAEETEG